MESVNLCWLRLKLHISGVIIKAKYALEAVVHDISGPGLGGIIRPGNVIICDILFMRNV